MFLFGAGGGKRNALQSRRRTSKLVGERKGYVYTFSKTETGIGNPLRTRLIVSSCSLYYNTIFYSKLVIRITPVRNFHDPSVFAFYNSDANNPNFMQMMRTDLRRTKYEGLRYFTSTGNAQVILLALFLRTVTISPCLTGKV